MTTVTAGSLQPGHARRQVQIIVNHQNRRQWNPMESRQRRNRQTAAVHEGHRLEQPQILADQRDPAGFAVIFRLRAKIAAVLTGQFVHQPEPGVVPGIGVLGARIAQPHYQPQRGFRFRHDGGSARRIEQTLAGRRRGRGDAWTFLAAVGVMDADHDRIQFGARGDVGGQFHPGR